jgi:hypothetical protein
MTTSNYATHGAADAALSFSGDAMQFKTHNEANIQSCGSCFQGHITATHDELCKLFGNPTDGDGYKVDAHWGLRFEDGTIATIYNWKDGRNYLGEEGKPVEQITDWHIGGMSRAALDKVQITIDLWRESQDTPKSMAEEAYRSAKDMMAAIKAQKGGDYAKVVEVAAHTKKLLDLNGHLLAIIVENKGIDDTQAELVHRLAGHIGASIIGAASRMAELEVSQQVADEVMEWADRVTEAEAKVGDHVAKEMGARRKKT